MAKRMASYFPQGGKLHVRNAALVGGVEGDGSTYAELGAPLAAGVVVMSGQSVNTTNAITTFDAAFSASEAQMGRFGRGLSLVLSAAGTPTLQVRGRDYLQQFMREDVVMNGTTPVATKKAFRYIDSVTPAAAGTAANLTVTLVNLFGLPFKFMQLDAEFKNQAPSANAGTFVPGLANTTPSTATSNDPRGTYTPVTVVPDGVNTFALRYFVDNNNAFGNAHFFA